MAEKQVTVFVVDVGSSMRKIEPSRGCTNLMWSLEFVWNKIIEKVIFGRKTDMIGLIGYNCIETKNPMQEHSGYDNIVIFSKIQSPSIKLMRHLQVNLSTGRYEAFDMQETKPDEKDSTDAAYLTGEYSDNGDAISALVVGIDMISSHCKHNKWLKKLYLIGSGQGLVCFENIDEITEQITKEKINFFCLVIDLDDPLYGFKEEEKSQTKRDFESQMIHFCEKCNGTMATMDEVIDSLKFPELKSIKPVSSFKGKLIIGDYNSSSEYISIDVERYPRTKSAKPISFQKKTKWHGNVNTDQSLRKPTMKKNDSSTDSSRDAVANSLRQYKTISEEVRNIDPSLIDKGFLFGTTVVPIADNELDILKFQGSPRMEILGFISQTKIPRWYYMSETNVIVNAKMQPEAYKALSSLVNAMQELKVAALTRCVAKTDSPPIMTLLSPIMETNFVTLCEVELPFAEDTRFYSFPPIDEVKTITGDVLKVHRLLATESMKASMSEYVDLMRISKVTNDADEQYNCEDAFNPLIRRSHDLIKSIALHHERIISTEFLGLRDLSNDYKKHLVWKLEKLKTQFKLHLVPEDSKPKYRHARDLTSEKRLDLDSLLSSEASIKNEIRDFSIKEFDIFDPIGNFFKALQNPSGLKFATNVMKNSIIQLIKQSKDDNAYRMILESISVFRKKMIEENEANSFNNFMKELKQDLLDSKFGIEHLELWELIQDNTLGLVSSKEAEDDTVEATEEHADEVKEHCSRKKLLRDAK